jgi:hypothetical protein
MADQPTPPARKPKPEFGEYAPEGWVNPITPEGSPEQNTVTPAAPAAKKQLDGVPHNLGVDASAPKKPDAANGGLFGANIEGKKLVDDEAAKPVTPGDDNAVQVAQGAQTAAKPKASRTTDRIFTIVLLAIGAYGALNLAGSLMNLSQVFAQLYAMYDLGPFTSPEWFGVLSTLGWMIPLGLWAVALIMSIQFMQRGKTAFFIPLVAGVVAFIVAIVLMSIAVTAAPELMTYFTENGFSLEDLR